jgi:hypothetical protein
MPDNFWFFLSYARADDREDLVGRFHRDLTAEVQAQAGVGQRHISFMDNDLDRGAAWEQELSESLSRSLLLVPLYSPSYFRSDFCGREWQFFYEQRLPIKPVWWRIPIATP